MAEIEELHVGDTGSEIRFRITDSGTAVDLSGATTLDAVLISPGGTRYAALPLVSTTDVAKTLALGWCRFTLAAVHVDAAGWIRFQARIVEGTSDVHTSTATRRVYPNL